MFYKLLYILFITAMAFGGPLHIGFTTPRQIMAVVMLLICVFNQDIVHKYFNKYLVLYILFLLFLCISNSYENTLSHFYRNLLSQHLVAFVCYFSCAIYYEKYNNINLILYTLFGCGIANLAVCMLQAIGHPIGILIGYYFIDLESASASHMRTIEDGGGYYLLGMKGDAVHNGYFQMIMPFIATYVHLKLQERVNSYIESIIYWLLIVLMFVGIFLIQERSCLLISVALFCIFWIMKVKRQNSTNIIVLTVLSYIALVFFEPFISSFFASSRFSIDNSEDPRVSLWRYALEFIDEHFWIGAENEYYQKFEFPPHNVLLNSFVSAGFFGFIATMILFIRQIIVSLESCVNFDKISTVAFAFMAIMLNSLLHNDSIISGDAMMWILWSLVFCYNIDNESIIVNDYEYDR